MLEPEKLANSSRQMDAHRLEGVSPEVFGIGIFVLGQIEGKTRLLGPFAKRLVRTTARKDSSIEGASSRRVSGLFFHSLPPTILRVYIFPPCHTR